MYVCLLFDEMKVREDWVYDKHSFRIIGFVDIVDINNCLNELQQTGRQQAVASNMLVFMVQCLLLTLKFPYAQFPCSSLSGEIIIYPLVWSCIKKLEICGFRVVACTADGASYNRRMNDPMSPFAHKTVNPYSDDERHFSDIPHLIKTVRNCWANSGAHAHTRRMEVSHNHCAGEFELSKFFVSIVAKLYSY